MCVHPFFHRAPYNERPVSHGDICPNDLPLSPTIPYIHGFHIVRGSPEVTSLLPV